MDISGLGDAPAGHVGRLLYVLLVDLNKTFQSNPASRWQIYSKIWPIPHHGCKFQIYSIPPQVWQFQICLNTHEFKALQAFKIDQSRLMDNVHIDMYSIPKCVYSAFYSINLYLTRLSCDLCVWKIWRLFCSNMDSCGAFNHRHVSTWRSEAFHKYWYFFQTAHCPKDTLKFRDIHYTGTWNFSGKLENTWIISCSTTFSRYISSYISEFFKIIIGTVQEVPAAQHS